MFPHKQMLDLFLSFPKQKDIGDTLSIASVVPETELCSYMGHDDQLLPSLTFRVSNVMHN